jgi:hypothetical protein
MHLIKVFVYKFYKDVVAEKEVLNSFWPQKSHSKAIILSENFFY